MYTEVVGDLDGDSPDEFLDVARAHLDPASNPSHIRLDCARLTLCDSMGFSTLPALHPSATALGVRLHLDHRLPFLDRMLLLTGT
ncbi:STAS domain-containing protein [Streptomyces sp. NPDC056549]|uniref:STAS domain-containing protein n=1 Tax=unclassified Streptomyces TaxID=2593676 RepID=UPI0036803E87